MIKINLATRKQATIGGEGPPKSLNDAFKRVDLDKLKELPIRQVAVPLAVALMANFGLETYKEEELKKISVIAEKVMAEGDKARKDLEKFKAFDSVKAQLDTDEAMIRTKVETIRKLSSLKGEAARILMSISTAIPKNVWLSELKVEGPTLSLKGTSLEYGQISDFMKALSEDAKFQNVELKSTQQAMDSETKVEVAEFELMAKRR